MYKSARHNVSEKRNVVRDMFKEGVDERFTNFIIQILDEQVNYGRERNPNKRKDHEEWILYTARLVGRLKITKGAPRLKILYENVDNPIIKGEIVYAAGATKNREILPWINRLLKGFNEDNRSGDTKAVEPAVEGVLKALNFYRDPSSFPEVFYASLPNYSRKIKEMAQQLLKDITEEPAKLCTEIIRKERADQKMILEAMEYAFNSNSPDEDKLEACLVALERALDTDAALDAYNLEIREVIKNTAVKHFAELKTTDKRAVDLIEKKWNSDIKYKSKKYDDVYTQLTNIEALQIIATEDAQKVLTRKIEYYNTRKQEGFETGYGEAEGGKIIVAIITAMGEIGIDAEITIIDPNPDQSASTSSALELQRILRSDEYGKPVQEAAKTALDKILNK